jgi:hypothetical protein
MFIGYGAFTSTQKYFALTTFSVNQNNQTIEIIHQFTVHELEYAIAEQKQKHFSPVHPQYDLYIKTLSKKIITYY